MASLWGLSKVCSERSFSLGTLSPSLVSHLLILKCWSHRVPLDLAAGQCNCCLDSSDVAGLKMCAPSIEGTQWVHLPWSMWCERPHGSQVSVFAGQAGPLGVTAILEAPRSVTSFPCVLPEPLSRGFSRLQRTRKVQTRMHVACFGGPRLADSQIQSKTNQHTTLALVFKKKKN